MDNSQKQQQVGVQIDSAAHGTVHKLADRQSKLTGKKADKVRISTCKDTEIQVGKDRHAYNPNRDKIEQKYEKGI